MWHFKNILNLFFCLLIVLGSCSSNSNTPGLKADRYVISFEEDAQSEQWATYLFNHLSKRITDKGSVEISKRPQQKSLAQGSKVIHVEIAADLKNDYCIQHSSERLHLRIKNKEVAVWIIYELIESISSVDNRVEAKDLPPATIRFSNGCRDFDFAYRDPHFAPNLQPEYAPVAGNNNVEADWGIWGHNLSKIVKAAEAPEEVYALVNNRRNKDQLSFTSEKLFDITVNYIIDNYGDGAGKGTRFMITPNDNDLVCSCATCTEAGNTANNATPAVNEFVRKLAERFPKHEFFITAYRTVKAPPAHQMAANTGVFLSTIDLPKGVELNSNNNKTKVFLDMLEAWKQKTANIYVWDYAANFDDYLSPMPVLYAAQKQFKFFKKQGIKGVFANAGGYDYIPFDDVKTYVLGALLKNTNADVETLVKKFFAKNYPAAHALLTAYYLKLEKDFDKKGKAYNMYGGINDNLATYLNAPDFEKFHTSLGTVAGKASGEEKARLKKLYTALTFTRLQLIYAKGTDAISQMPAGELKILLETLEGYKSYADMQRYRESGGELSAYMDEWKSLLTTIKTPNQLKGTSIKLLSRADEGYETPGVLNDGLPGFATDYHQGWYISSIDDLHISFPAQQLQNAEKIKCRFLYNEDHRFLPPEKIEIKADGRLIKTITNKEIALSGAVAACEAKIPLAGTKNIELKFYRPKDVKSKIAIDEIFILK